jgi:hypothetical protein
MGVIPEGGEIFVESESVIFAGFIIKLQVVEAS